MAWPSRSAFLFCSYLLRFDDVPGARLQYHSVLRSASFPHISAVDRRRTLRDSRSLAAPVGMDLESRPDSEPDVRPRFLRQHLEFAVGSTDVFFPAVHILVCPQIGLVSSRNADRVD